MKNTILAISIGWVFLWGFAFSLEAYSNHFLHCDAVFVCECGKLGNGICDGAHQYNVYQNK